MNSGRFWVGVNEVRQHARDIHQGAIELRTRGLAQLNWESGDILVHLFFPLLFFLDHDGEILNEQWCAS